MIFQTASAVAALIAAGFWMYSACMRIPDMKDMKLSGVGSPTWFIAKQSKFSAIAAASAAISALAQAADIVCHISNSGS